MHEDKRKIVAGIINVLRLTRAGYHIKHFEYSEEKEIVTIMFESGNIKKVSIEADSGIAIIYDIVRSF